MTLPQLQQFVEGAAEVGFRRCGNDEARHRHIEDVLRRFGDTRSTHRQGVGDALPDAQDRRSGVRLADSGAECCMPANLHGRSSRRRNRRPASRGHARRPSADRRAAGRARRPRARPCSPKRWPSPSSTRRRRAVASTRQQEDRHRRHRLAPDTVPQQSVAEAGCRGDRVSSTPVGPQRDPLCVWAAGGHRHDKTLAAVS